MELNRQELLTLAITVGLVLGVDFEKNISNANLQKKIEEKQEQLGKELKGDQAENQEQVSDNFDNFDSEDEEDEDNALIMRKTECFTYKTEIIGFKETARRSNLTVEEVKEAIETGKPAGGYIFEFVG